MKQSIGFIFVILTLLFSMTEISKVALMGYTMFTDGEKAAQFCTCMGCSHNNNSNTEHCAVNMDVDADSDSSHGNKSHEAEHEPTHCNITTTASGESVCGCDKESPGEMHILFNTLDKTALLANFQYGSGEFNKTIYHKNRVKNPVSVQRDIFHPPRA